MLIILNIYPNPSSANLRVSSYTGISESTERLLKNVRKQTKDQTILRKHA